MQFLSKIPGNFMNFQNFMEAELLDPVLWNFAWINGRLYAFRWNQSEFLKMNTLGTIKVLLVSLAFEHRVCIYLYLIKGVFLVMTTIATIPDNTYVYLWLISLYFSCTYLCLSHQGSVSRDDNNRDHSQ